ncbi:MAG: hypothetical protein IKN70_10060 [Fibrobacter sp.]|nr:hypothetical protein [Fibrobacter sp.]
MICPKCGDKYEDDMPRCLWCDAPNPNYGEGTQPSFPKKVSVIKRNIGEIESDSEVFHDGTVFKLGRTKHVLNTIAMIFWLGFGLFYGAAWPFGFFDNMPTLLCVIFLGTAVMALYAAFIFSKKVLKVTWFKDKFVLCTRYGEKEVRFDELVDNCADVDRFNRLFFVFKKNGKKFQVSDDDYPNVVQELCKISDKLAEKDVVQNYDGTEYVIYKPLVYIGEKSRIAISLVGTVFIALFFPLENALLVTCYVIFLFCCFCIVFEGVKAVREIMWYSDKFVLCTYFGEKTFLFEQTAPRKIKYDKNGNCRFTFKKGWLPFIVDERFFPEIVEKLKERYEKK